MKLNWGTGIFIFLIIFLSLAGLFMYFAFSQDVNLVNEEYYKKGVDYTVQMQKEKRSEKYVSQIYLEDKDSNITVFFPDNFSENLQAGTILFYRPSDRRLDVEHNLKPEGNMQKISKEKLIKGRYIVQIEWERGSQEYYIEKELFVK